MKRKKAIPITFNMSLGLIPIILCMILSEFILDKYAIYISAAIGLMYSFLSYYLSHKKIFNFILYLSTIILGLVALSTFFGLNMFPKGTIPLTLEIVLITFTILLFYGQKIIKNLFNRKQYPQKDDLIIKSLDSSIVSARIISIIGILHLIILSIFLIINNPLQQEIKVILLHIFPPILLFFSIIINQIGIYFANHVMGKEEEIPIVNEQGNVIGKRFKTEAATYKNKYINPIIRIAFINNGMIFLCSRKQDCIIEKGKVDIPFEGYLRYGESLEDGVKRLIQEVYPKGTPIHPRFSIKHHFKNDETNRLVYLYIAYIEDDSLLNRPEFKNGKLWTFQQIEHNLGKHYFSTCFEEEYEHLKSSASIWEEFK